MADLVDHSGTHGPELVRLPQQRHLARERARDGVCARRRSERIVELGEQTADPDVRGEDRAPGHLRRMCRQDELERQRRRLAPAEPFKGVLQGLARHAFLSLVLAPPSRAVVLLRDVDELEVDRECANNRRLLLER